MTNPRIEKVNSDIAKTKAKIAEYTVKLRALERQKINLENEEIVALYRRENFNDDEFTALLRSRKKTAGTAEQDSLDSEVQGVSAQYEGIQRKYNGDLENGEETI